MTSYFCDGNDYYLSYKENNFFLRKNQFSEEYQFK